MLKEGIPSLGRTQFDRVDALWAVGSLVLKITIFGDNRVRKQLDGAVRSRIVEIECVVKDDL